MTGEEIIREFPVRLEKAVRGERATRRERCD